MRFCFLCSLLHKIYLVLKIYEARWNGIIIYHSSIRVVGILVIIAIKMLQDQPTLNSRVQGRLFFFTLQNKFLTVVSVSSEL